MEKINFEIIINKDVQTVWHKMLDLESYKEWTKAFNQDSFYEGAFEEGADIKFMSADRSGMSGFIKELRPYEFVSIEYKGYLKEGVLDLETEGSTKFVGAHENYTFTKISDTETKVYVELDVPEEYKSMMIEMWSKAIEKLKEICEV